MIKIKEGIYYYKSWT